MTAPPDEPDQRRPAASGPTASGPLARPCAGSHARAGIRADDGAGDPGTDSAEVEAKAADRVIFFSDAVVAIALTLLALDLPVPDLPGATFRQYLQVIRFGYPGGAHHPAWPQYAASWPHTAAYWPQYAAFLISFAVIAGHWSGHRRAFRYVNRLAGPVGRLNTIWLLMMILTPFGARLLWSSGGFPIRFSTYVLIQVIAFSCLLQINRQVIQLGLLRADTPASFYERDTLPTVITIALFLASIPVSFVTGWAYVLWGATPGVERVIHLFQARRRSAGVRTGTGRRDHSA